MTFKDLRSDLASTTKEMLVSEAPCAQAITLMPLRPNVPKSFPAMPGVCFIFSPTIAMVAKFISATTGLISPISISFCKFFIQHLTSQCSILITDTDGSAVLRRSLRHHEHTDAILRQCLEDAEVYADHSHHAQTCNRNQSGVIDRRNTFNGF